MSNLKDRIKKELIQHLVDLAVVIGVIFFMIYIVAPIEHSTYSIIAGVTMIVGFVLLQRYIDKQFGKWSIPELDIGEYKSYNIYDTTYSIVMSIIIVAILYRYIDWRILAGLLVVLMIIKEVRKWREYNKMFMEKVEELVKGES